MLSGRRRGLLQPTSNQPGRRQDPKLAPLY